jgi:hypothetical protein
VDSFLSEEKNGLVFMKYKLEMTLGLKKPTEKSHCRPQESSADEEPIREIGSRLRR